MSATLSSITVASPVINVTFRSVTSYLKFITINKYEPTVERDAFSSSGTEVSVS